MGISGPVWQERLMLPTALTALLGKRELAAPVEDVSAEVVGVAFPDVVDEVAGVGVLEGHQFAGDHHLEGLGLADEAGQASGTTGTGKHTEVDFGQADLAGVLASDADVGGHGDFKSTADGVAVDGTHDEFGRLLEAREGFVGVKAEVVLEAGADAVEHLDGGACREEGGTVAGQDDAGDAVVKTSTDDGFVDVSHHAVGVGVGRAVVGALKGGTGRVGGEFNDGDAVVGHTVVDKSVWHGFKFQSIEVAHALSHRGWYYEEIAEISCASPSALLVKET